MARTRFPRKVLLWAGCGCSNQGIRRHIADGQAADFNVGYGARILNGCRSASGLSPSPASKTQLITNAVGIFGP